MISLDLQTFRQIHKGGNVTGVIFLNLGGQPYPENDWSDFPVIILGWWADALLQLEEPSRFKVRWQFMDGPFGLSINKTEDESSAGVPILTDLHRILIEASQHVIAHCDQQGLQSKDLDLLKDHTNRLKANQPVQPTRLRLAADR
ncbi:MAG: hypothetical protein HC904_16855 [Blastochloris sp.]|nr:hypothetical protein [Blastochloris sp.]